MTSVIIALPRKPYIYRPYDKQGAYEPFDVQKDWDEKLSGAK